VAMYRCEGCDRFKDDDYHPLEEIDGRLLCPGCVVESPKWRKAQKFSADQLKIIKNLENESDDC